MRHFRTSRLAPLLTTALMFACAGESERDTASAVDSLSLVTAPHRGADALDARIRRIQQRIEEEDARPELLERLGWAFVAKGRAEGDPGLYKLAEHAAHAADAIAPGRNDAALLRGHALHSLHRFAAAESIARTLVDRRGLAYDWALLGDIRLDRGDLHEAERAYQRMMDLRPDAHAYGRAAHLRFLTGDLKGAAELMHHAARSSSPRNPANFVWTRVRLADYVFALGSRSAALEILERALAVAPNSAPALFAKGRILLVGGDAAASIPFLERAAARGPLPERLHALSEAYALVGNSEAATSVFERLVEVGERVDARGLALVLGSTGADAERAVALAERELAERADVYTLDTLAWARAGTNDIEGAWQLARRAVAVGTRDARIFLHAGVIAASAGEHEAARELLRDATSLAHTLLPSEREELLRRTSVWGSPRNHQRNTTKETQS